MKIYVCTSKFIYRCALVRSHDVIVQFLSLIFLMEFKNSIFLCFEHAYV